MKRLAAMTIATILLAQGAAFAHEGEHHPDAHKADVQMQKLHHLMSLYAQAQARIKEALTNKDATTVRGETAKILDTIADLEKSKPHKNLKQITAFRKIASTFAENVRKTAVLANNGDFVGAGNAFQLAQTRCDECHKKFRD